MMRPLSLRLSSWGNLRDAQFKTERAYRGAVGPYVNSPPSTGCSWPYCLKWFMRLLPSMEFVRIYK